MVAVGGCKAVGGLPEESPPNTGNTLTEFQENVSLKDKMALYQAAVSKAENSNRFANVRYQCLNIFLILRLLCPGTDRNHLYFYKQAIRWIIGWMKI